MLLASTEQVKLFAGKQTTKRKLQLLIAYWTPVEFSIPKSINAIILKYNRNAFKPLDGIQPLAVAVIKSALGQMNNITCVKFQKTSVAQSAEKPCAITEVIVAPATPHPSLPKLLSNKYSVLM